MFHPSIQPLEVDGKRIPHFRIRQAAARAIAGVTGKKAAYTGLAGELLDSADMPREPYKEQTELLTAFYREQLLRIQPNVEPRCDAEWRVKDHCDTLLRRLQETFGKEIGN